MIRKYLKAADSFLREHWIGIILVSIVTGVMGNFVYDAVKPQDPSTRTQPNGVLDPQQSAQAMRTSASSLRAIATNHMRSPPPAKWLEAEKLYKDGMEHYARSEFNEARINFDAAYRIYNDLYEQAAFDGH